MNIFSQKMLDVFQQTFLKKNALGFLLLGTANREMIFILNCVERVYRCTG